MPDRNSSSPCPVGGRLKYEGFDANITIVNEIVDFKASACQSIEGRFSSKVRSHVNTLVTVWVNLNMDTAFGKLSYRRRLEKLLVVGNELAVRGQGN